MAVDVTFAAGDDGCVCGVCDGCGGDERAGVSEKEWTHHGLLLISGLHQMAECSSREAIEKEQIAEARIEGVKV